MDSSAAAAVELLVSTVEKGLLSSSTLSVPQPSIMLSENAKIGRTAELASSACYGPTSL